MDLINVVENMSEDMYLRLKHAAETGKWPEGNEVGKEQQENALQLIMAYQAKHLNSDEILTVGSNGEIVTKTKRELKASFAKQNEAIARFTDL
ncbi:YeaC family protein [Thalassotalea piscium]|uniref:DUF1315 family protein n=1 Tax=Thalassotalea piscium TaxID=1230533 RepID=A0A7X0NF72_9GAMM|nr:DUF1315 family protein [Thalassotalea piscium]MBB6542358.1 hypothetical protein [Thalassotalea piscium]